MKLFIYYKYFEIEELNVNKMCIVIYFYFLLFFFENICSVFEIYFVINNKIVN